jgi:hypothetical protein
MKPKADRTRQFLSKVKGKVKSTMNAPESIHVIPINGRWAVMTDSRELLKQGLASRKDAVKAAGQVAADGKYQFLVIHTKDDLVPSHIHAA